MAIARIENVDDIECTLEFTLRIKDWKQIRKTLNSNAAYIEMEIITEISDLVHQLEKVFYVDQTPN